VNFRKIVGRIIYFAGYPILMLLLRGSTRAYAVIRCNNKILLTQSTLDYKPRWHLPGGGVKKNETTVAGLIREIHEELGIVVTADQLVPLNNSPISSKHHYEYHLYLVELSSMPELTLRRFEIIDAKFIPFNDLDSMLISDTVKRSIPLIPLK
jgi:8-oxo-dGTP pyrophosphatase MutT (NUDIX family)